MAPLGEGERPIEIVPLVREAAAQAGAGNTEAALGILTPLIESGQSSIAARFVLAMTAWRMGRLDWSLELINGCHESAPMDGTIAEAMASLQAQVGDVVESIYAGKLATALGPASPLMEFLPAGFPPFDVAYRAIKERPLLASAKQHLAAGRIADAVDKARQQVAINGDDSESRDFYAAAVLRAGRASDTVEQLYRLESEGCDSGALASLYARSLAAVGDHAASRRWHAQAQSLASQDPDITAARIADGTWLETPEAIATAGEAWSKQFCPPPKPRAWRQPEERMVIAYLVAKLADPYDAAAIAAVARAHDRKNVRVIGYGTGAQSWDENLELRGCFDSWQDIGALDGATLARYAGQDRVNVLIDASGFAAPKGLQALARVATAVRVSWLGNSAALRAPIYDAHIASSGGGKGDWCVDGGYPTPQPITIPARIDHAVPQFGSEVSLAQLCEDTVAAWSQILRAVPEAKLLLRIADAGSGNVDRLVSRFGRELAARIDLVAAERFEFFYARLDVALAPWRGVSPRMAAEASACRVPIVALARSSAVEPYGAFLRGVCAGVPHLAGDADDYVRRAVALARTPFQPSDLPAGDAASFARALERYAKTALQQVPVP